jgi:transposase
MYCGIDVSKDKSNVCIIDNKSNVLHEFEIDNVRVGFEKLEKHLTEETVIGMESTGNYAKPLYSFLSKKYNVYLVDNLKMRNFAKISNPHLKNDKIDAKLISKYLSYDFNKFKPLKDDELKDLARLYYKTIKKYVRLKFMYKSQIAAIFPELDKEFYLHRTMGVAYMLLKYPTPKDILNAKDDEIYTALVENLKVNSFYNSEYVQKIKECAKSSVGIEDYPVSCFKYTIKIMLFYQSLVKEILVSMKTSLAKTPYARLLDEFGYSVPSLATIVGEITDIRRFSNHKKLVRYCGFDVSQKQSGNSSSVNCFITKRGNRQLRHIFYTLVLTHLAKKNELCDFYQRLKTKGKHPVQCMVAAARKLTIKAYYDMLHCHNNQFCENIRQTPETLKT